MNHKETQEFVEALYPFFLKKLQEDGYLKNVVRIKNATVVSIPDGTNINKEVQVSLPYDTVSFSAINRAGEELSVGNTICLLYWIDLKNSVVMFKI